MREIKFMAWHTKLKKMFSAAEMGEDQLAIMPDGRGFANIHDTKKLTQFSGDTMIPLQFIGRQDKHGNDIYEGFLLRHGYDAGVCFEVFYNDYWARFDCSRPHYQGNRCGGRVPEITSSEFEIIGNIYENPELSQHP